MAIFDCWLAALCDHRGVLAPGEVGVVLVISRDQRVAKVILNYVEGILRSSELLASLSPIALLARLSSRNGIGIEVRLANYRTLGGPTYVAVTCDVRHITNGVAIVGRIGLSLTRAQAREFAAKAAGSRERKMAVAENVL